jgi:hypothetical protein
MPLLKAAADAAVASCSGTAPAAATAAAGAEFGVEGRQLGGGMMLSVLGNFPRQSSSVLQTGGMVDNTEGKQHDQAVQTKEIKASLAGAWSVSSKTVILLVVSVHYMPSLCVVAVHDKHEHGNGSACSAVDDLHVVPQPGSVQTQLSAFRDDNVAGIVFVRCACACVRACAGGGLLSGAAKCPKCESLKPLLVIMQKVRDRRRRGGMVCVRESQNCRMLAQHGQPCCSVQNAFLSDMRRILGGL